MPNPAPDRLRQIKTFPSLVKYLRDELEWPIDSDDFEELTFHYEPEELGLDAKAAVSIKHIKQLRPLADKQPWGIFFINFEPKRLPVVALRRILRSLVIKKRQSANRPQQAAWQLHDLLFISSYGESDHRDITFAHFSEDADHDGGLPTLRVLGWDDEDTVLHLDHADATLKEKLRWPDNEVDLDAWRSHWSSAFTLRHREVINTSKMLAVRMAELASAIRKRANRVLDVESDEGPLRKLMSAFKEALIHDLSDDGFADMYAQTITYGLLTARVSRPAGLVAGNIADMVPVTNPFLKELMETFLDIGGRQNGRRRESGIDFDELGVNDVVDTLRAANMEAVLRDFGDRNPQEDPVIHFYELFLKEYDPKKRMQRGVFYTPRPVVSFIVRSVDELLRTEFGLQDGLADTTTWGEMVEKNDELKLPEIETTNPKTNNIEKKPIDASKPFVQILDPATGTATFLVEVIDVIHRTMVAKWQKQGHTEMYDIPDLWNEYVPQHLLPRLHGYELMMAPYAIAHMKIGLKLHETGYRFESDERARVYLTNALEPPKTFQMSFDIPALAHEAEAVNAIKRNQRFTVLIGNPPYSKLSANLSLAARTIVDPYRFVEGSKIKERGALQFEMNLQEDYVKFTRLYESKIMSSGCGLLGVITNSGYLTTPTLRGMRFSLTQSFSTLRLLDLHGHVATAKRDDSIDENVFDIRQGVAIMLASTPIQNGGSATVYTGKRSTRDEKYRWLQQNSVTTAGYAVVSCSPPLYRFVPEDNRLRSEFEMMDPLPSIFPRNSAGFISSRDGLVICENRQDLLASIRAFGFDERTPAEIYAAYKFSPSKRLDLREAQAVIRREKDLSRSVRPVLYRPFDQRHVFYKRELIESFKPIAFELDVADNLVLLATRQVTREPFEHAFVSRCMVEIKVCSHDRNTQTFPLFISDESSESVASQHRLSGKSVSLNICQTFIRRLEVSTQMRLSDRAASGSFTAQGVFQYVYAILHSPSYRTRYFDLLKSEFPRCPAEASRHLFGQLADLGQELVALHLMRSPKLDDHITTLVSSGEFQVEKVSYSDETVWIDKAKTDGFRGVPEKVWNFHIGGYQVCEKWLKDRQAKGGKNPRPGRVLTDDDIAHYQKIVVALSETIRIMAEIDEVIEAHGGWPDAFVTGEIVEKKKRE